MLLTIARALQAHDARRQRSTATSPRYRLAGYLNGRTRKPLWVGTATYHSRNEALDKWTLALLFGARESIDALLPVTGACVRVIRDRSK